MLVAAVAIVVLLVPNAQAAVVVKAVASATSPTDYAFAPKTVEVPVGTKVTWRAVVGIHDVTSWSKNWSKASPLLVGSPTSYTFKKIGAFRYRCTIHSSIVDGRCRGQCGRVIVG